MGCTTSSLPPLKPSDTSSSQQLGRTNEQNHMQTIQVQSGSNAPRVIVSRQQTVAEKLPEISEHDDNIENMMHKANAKGGLPTLSEPKSRTASAQSAVSNISTASKGIAYEFKLNDGNASIVKAHPPKALKRLEVPPEMKLTFDQLNTQLNAAEERKSKIIAEKQERLKTMASGRAPLRPKTAVSNPVMEEKLEKNMAQAEERKKKITEDIQKKQQEKDARARRVRDKAKTLQNPEFVNKMDTFGNDGNLDAPLSPMPPIKNHVDSFVVESEPVKKEKDDEFFG